MYKLTGAAARGNLQEVRDLLDSGVPVDAEYANKTPLVFAASWLKVDVVRLLLRRGHQPCGQYRPDASGFRARSHRPDFASVP